MIVAYIGNSEIGSEKLQSTMEYRNSLEYDTSYKENISSDSNIEEDVRNRLL